ncbi:MAG: ADP-forming succinate--CoA ligase subunit beta [Mariprofundales bacterium]|nr:ADP-forming succinate--CoA ligase subunit beta [Mariprofundales bacterium]
MNIHEYQAKSVLASFAVPTPRGVVATTVDEAVQAIESLGSAPWVVKAQIHAGGRGKAGGVRLCRSADEVRGAAHALLGSRLITHQTGAEGRVVQRLYIEEGLDTLHEYYLSLLIDREHGKPAFVVSPHGGMDIEQVAAQQPQAIHSFMIDDSATVTTATARAIAEAVAVESDMQPLLQALLNTFIQRDASLIELNPLADCGDGRLIALDAKMAIDDNALYRQPEMAELRDLQEENRREIEAAAYGLNYIALNGTIGCMVNGAGLAMATMDIIQRKGGEPANFLDVGGGVTVESATEGFKLLLSDPHVQAVLVNIFGGIVRCDIIAKGLLAAQQAVQSTAPVIMRLVGTHEQEGQEALRTAGADVRWAQSLNEAAELAVAAAG